MMNLDEAIEHCKEKGCGDTKCAAEHRQLAEWLKELKELRSENYPKLTDGIGQTRLGFTYEQIQAIERYVKRYIDYTLRFQSKPIEWNIDNVKCGDILAYPDGTLAMFNYRLGGLDAGLYMSFLVCSSTGINYKQTCAINNATKATKEQCDQLEKAMADAGYKWNKEERKLEKIIVPVFHIGDTIAKKHNSDIHDFGSFTITDITGGKYWYNDRIICDITEQDEWELYEPVRQKIAWSEEDETTIDNLVWAISNDMIRPQDRDDYCDWLKSLKDRVQPQPKQEWNEEDERMWSQVINEIEAIKSNSSTVFEKNIAQDKIDWLKSLKDRYTWKPSDEQIDCLSKHIEYERRWKSSHALNVLSELLEQLKKLKG